MGSNNGISRRKVLQSTCAGAAALSIKWAFAQSGMPGAADNGEPQVGDTFAFTDGPHKGKVVTLEDIVVDAPPVVVQAKNTVSGAVRDGDHSTILLWRVAAENVPADSAQYAAQGTFAFSAVCTHQGCIVSDWVADKKWFHCPCHGATFDPMQAGERTGGPQARALPILPLKVLDGKLVVADAFTGTVGPRKG